MNEYEMLDALETARQKIERLEIEVIEMKRVVEKKQQVSAKLIEALASEMLSNSLMEAQIEDLKAENACLRDAIAAQHTPAPSRLDPTHTPGGLTPLSAQQGGKS